MTYSQIKGRPTAPPFFAAAVSYFLAKDLTMLTIPLMMTIARKTALIPTAICSRNDVARAVSTAVKRSVPHVRTPAIASPTATRNALISHDPLSIIV